MNTTSTVSATREIQDSFEFELHIEKSKAEHLGFTFVRMADYFAPLKMSKHLYRTDFVGDSFVIGLRETPEQLRRILDFSLKTDRGEDVKVKNLCTVHHKDA